MTGLSRTDPPTPRTAGGGPDAAVILTGGTGARMDGADKAALELDGASLLERALAATAGADTVVVGVPAVTSRPVTWTREEPPGGGPAAGLLAGLAAFGSPPDLVGVLAVDMPRVSAGTLARLAGALADPAYDGAVLVDGEGRTQPLCGVYRAAALERARPARPEDESGLPVHRLLDGLAVCRLLAEGEESRDVDTWADLRELGGTARS